MKNLYFVIWATSGIALAILIISENMAINSPNNAELWRFWGYFFSLALITGVSFKGIVLWEIATGRLEKNTSKPASANNKVLVSSYLLRLGGLLTILFALTSFLSLWGSYDNWLGRIWEPLRIISGWPSFIGSLILFFSCLISAFLRDDARYLSKKTTEQNIAQSV